MDDAARLEVSAALVERLIATPDGRIAARWRRPAFARSVDSVLRQLAPIQDREALLASYGREAGRMRRRGTDPWILPGADAVLEVAYALRWMELAHRHVTRPFRTLVAEPPQRGRRARPSPASSTSNTSGYRAEARSMRP